jgi:hypothetical protein
VSFSFGLDRHTAQGVPAKANRRKVIGKCLKQKRICISAERFSMRLVEFFENQVYGSSQQKFRQSFVGTNTLALQHSAPRAELDAERKACEEGPASRRSRHDPKTDRGIAHNASASFFNEEGNVGTASRRIARRDQNARERPTCILSKPGSDDQGERCVG